MEKVINNYLAMETWQIVLIVIGSLCLIAMLIIIITSLIQAKKKKEFFSKRKEEDIKIVSLLGGQDNIISYKASGSRLNLTLKDYSLVNESELKEKGVSSLIKMQDKLILVIGEEAKEIEEYLNSLTEK